MHECLPNRNTDALILDGTDTESVCLGSQQAVCGDRPVSAIRNASIADAMHALQAVKANYRAAGKLLEANAMKHALAVLRKMQ
jgi:hypothetical protein